MLRPTAEALAPLPLFRRVSPDDRARIAAAASLREFDRGEHLFLEGDDSANLFVVATGRVKVYKHAPDGRDVILEFFSPGGAIGAVAAYEARPYPASAIAVESTTCVTIPRDAFFQLLERHPSLVRGLLGSLSLRLVELTTRLAELTGGHIDARLARLFVKLADQMGRPERGGVFIPLPLSRQDLADLTGTTIETAIRIMSRWNKDLVVQTEREGFLLLDRAALEQVARS
jgi:CRP/FNR family transcriptional regulator